MILYVSVMSWFDFSSVEFMAPWVASSTPSWRRRSSRETDTASSHRSQRMYSTQQSEGGREMREIIIRDRERERERTIIEGLMCRCSVAVATSPQVYPAVPERDCRSQNSYR